MAFLKTDKNNVEKEAAGILYILVMEIDGTAVYKIGVTQRKIEERVVEILASFFKSYRYFPWTRPKRFKSTSNVYSKEALLHRYYKKYKYTPEHVFGGSSEFFTGIELDELVDVYERCIAGEDLSAEIEANQEYKEFELKEEDGIH